MKKTNENGYVLINGIKIDEKSELGKWLRNSRDAMRIKQRRHGQCCCPFSKSYYCTTDCINCKYCIKKDISIDSIYSSDGEEYGEEYIYQQTPNEYISFEDSFVDKEEAKDILNRVFELMPEAETIGKLLLDGYTFTEVSEKLDIKRTTLASRIKKMRNVIMKEFPEKSF